MSSSVKSTVNGEANTMGDYEVLEILGEGCFGRVSKCIHQKTKEIVALKVMKEKIWVEKELKMMKALRELDPDTFNIIRFIEHFEHNEGQCMAFEVLDLNVDDFMIKYQVDSISLNKVRPMAKQLLVALEGLNRLGIMHTDIKPDNIMLVDHEKQPFKVKLIDFGVAMHKYDADIGVEMQNPNFRAPEVNLGLPLSEAVDMWSLGCCLAACYLGEHPFVGYSEYDNLSKIVHFMGTPENELLNKALYADYFFVQEGSQWRLKTLQEYQDATGDNPEMVDTDLTEARDLEDLIKNFKRFLPFPESDDRAAFFDLLKKMFEVNPEKRVTPSDALLFPFITMNHLPAEGCYTEESHALMSVALIQIPPLEKILNLNVTLKDKKQEESGGPSNVDDTKTHQEDPHTALEIWTVLDTLKECSEELPLDWNDLLTDIDKSCPLLENADSTGANRKKTKKAIWSLLGRLVPRSIRVFVESLLRSKKTRPSKPKFPKLKWAKFF